MEYSLYNTILVTKAQGSLLKEEVERLSEPEKREIRCEIESPRDVKAATPWILTNMAAYT